MSEDFKVPGLNYEVTPSPYRGSAVENPGLDELRERAALAYEKNLEGSETPKTPENTIDTPQLDFLKTFETKEENPVKKIADITEGVAKLRKAYQMELDQTA